ncbi:hypothetical protein CHU98_g10705 [Xylaria longipes]|nr:hypothetical protein CHU98_g10705 [Xylaria longipes]
MVTGPESLGAKLPQLNGHRSDFYANKVTGGLHRYSRSFVGIKMAARWMPWLEVTVTRAASERLGQKSWRQSSAISPAVQRERRTWMATAGMVVLLRLRAAVSMFREFESESPGNGSSQDPVLDKGKVVEVPR